MVDKRVFSVVIESKLYDTRTCFCYLLLLPLLLLSLLLIKIHCCFYFLSTENFYQCFYIYISYSREIYASFRQVLIRIFFFLITNLANVFIFASNSRFVFLDPVDPAREIRSCGFFFLIFRTRAGVPSVVVSLPLSFFTQ